ncbi:hypothetical protein QPC07_002854 [Enterococcus faecalis]|nr:hypothetical protein [Enterococcus faecalis]
MEEFLKADIFIFENNGEIEDFIGLQGNYIAAFFVRKEKLWYWKALITRS